MLSGMRCAMMHSCRRVEDWLGMLDRSLIHTWVAPSSLPSQRTHMLELAVTIKPLIFHLDPDLATPTSPNGSTSTVERKMH